MRVSILTFIQAIQYGSTDQLSVIDMSQNLFRVEYSFDLDLDFQFGEFWFLDDLYRFFGIFFFIFF